jgi:hypothetical protein
MRYLINKLQKLGDFRAKERHVIARRRPLAQRLYCPVNLFAKAIAPIKRLCTM